jgi:diaminohydroxyphosphoribosylaminopyrimidine deaminase/5-amino-6-(5-phosphoribosylamino)uracil reductase
LDDGHYIQLAFELAERGRGLTHPNPRVGAVVVADGEVVGRGFHRGPGLPHAEVEALAEAGARARGAALYCTLEPCAHQGRTPPCADAIVAAGVGRVVAALQDPNPLVNGRGFERLRAAGVVAELMGGEAARRAERLNAPFLKYQRRGLPYVTYKAAVSLDGKVAGADGAPRRISGDESHRLVHAMRALADAVLIGAGTLRRDDPQLTVRACEGRDPLRVVLTRSGPLPLASRLFADARETPTLVLAADLSHARERALLALGVQVERFDGSLPDALRRLAARGALEVLLEGGPLLAGALFADGLVDRVALFVAPLIIGRGAPDLVALPAGGAAHVAVRLRDAAWQPVGDDMLLEADVEVA